MRTQPTRTAGRLMMQASSAVLVLGLSACSSGSSGSDSGARSGGASSSTSWSGSRDAYDVKIAGCLRDKGLDLKDPEPGKGIQEDSPEIREAASDCFKKLGIPPVADGKKLTPAEVDSMIKKESDCLKDRGLDVEPTKPGEAVLFVPEDATQEDIDTCLGIKD